MISPHFHTARKGEEGKDKKHYGWCGRWLDKKGLPFRRGVHRNRHRLMRKRETKNVENKVGNDRREEGGGGKLRSVQVQRIRGQTHLVTS